MPDTDDGVSMILVSEDYYGTGEFCCQGECCGPGSWCCSHAGPHDHDRGEGGPS